MKSRALYLNIFQKNTEYAAEEAEDLNNHIEISTIEGVFLDSKAVCSGYARAYQYLLSMAGIDSMMISGTSKNIEDAGEHAWLVQCVDGETYFSDPTWADVYEQDGKSFVSHAFFLMSSSDIKDTHICDTPYAFIKSTYDTNKYFLDENLYFEEYNQGAVRAAIKNSLEQGSSAVEFKFATDEAYEKANTLLFDNENIHFILMSIDLFSQKIDANSVTYSCVDTHRVITIFLN